MNTRFDNNQRPRKRVGGSFKPPQSFRAGQARHKDKVKQPPPPPKPCTVYLGSVALYYNKPNKMLVLAVDGTHTRFPSRKKAHRAIWNTCQQRAEREKLSGRELALQYAIVEAGNE